METAEEMKTEAPLDEELKETEESSCDKETSEEVDWQARCLAAESTLADSLIFAALESGVKMEESTTYRRFLDLRAKGLTAGEAFAAAGWERAEKKSESERLPSKAHLVSGAPVSLASSRRIPTEEMALARDLLGEGYSSDDIEKLWRRVAKGQ